MEATLNELLRHAPVFVRRRNGEILHWTEGCQDLYGYTVDEARGCISHELLKTRFPEDLSKIEVLLDEEGEWSGRLRHTAKDGREIWTLALWLQRQSTEPGGMIVVEQNSDVTSQVELEEQRALLARELEHRVKNLLTVVQSLARLSFPDAPAEQRNRFDARLVALAEANRLLREASWEETGLGRVVTEVARGLSIEGRIRVEGPEVTISSQHVMAMALAIHELCTNALKHGALTRPAGYVELRWSIDPNRADSVHIVWQEHGGPTPEQPSHAGFGTRLLQSAVSRQIGSPVRLGFEATGLICEMRLTRGTSNGKTSSTARRVKRRNKGR